MRTKEQRRSYNKEYSARPEVKERAKVRNARPERVAVRIAYKRTEKGKLVNRRSRVKNWGKNAPLREKQLLWRYGLTPAQFEEMLLKQEGKCAICLIPSEKRLHIDHCHKTGKVRGLLCGNCNMALGLFKDNEQLLIAASVYLYEKS